MYCFSTRWSWCKPYGGLQIHHIIFEAQLFDIIMFVPRVGKTFPGIAAETMQGHHTDAVGMRFIGGQDHAAFAGGHVFCDVKAEAAEIAERTQSPALVLGLDGMGAVFDKFEAVFPGQSAESVHIAGASGKMHGQNGPGARGKFAPDVRDVDIHGDGVNIGQDGSGAGVEDGIGCCRKGQRRRDNFVTGLEFEAEQAQVQGRSAGVHRDGMGGFAVRGKGLLKTRHLGAGAQPAVAQAVHNLIYLSIIDEWLAEDQKLVFRTNRHGLLYSEHQTTAMGKKELNDLSRSVQGQSESMEAEL